MSEQNKLKKVIFLINGEVGGIGKSTLTKLVLEYLQERVAYDLYDLDSNKLDVGLVYEKEQYTEDAKDIGGNVPKHMIRFSDDDMIGGTVDLVFEQSLENVVVVNTPSNCKHHLDSWIKNNDLLGLAKSQHIQFINLFITLANPDSINLFKESLDSYGHNLGIQQVMAFNEGKGMEYERATILHPRLKELADTYKVPVLKIPKLNSRYYNDILTKQLTFYEAKHKTDNTGLKLIGRQATSQFLKSFETEFSTVLRSLGGTAEQIVQRSEETK